MNHIIIFKTAHHMHDGVDFANVGQKFVAQAFSLACPLHQTSDINKLHSRWNGVLTFAEVRQRLETVVRNRHRAHIGLDRAERKIGSLRLSVGHQCVEQRGLAHIGQSNNSGFKHEAESTGRQQRCC